jgi:hypothetical protein
MLRSFVPGGTTVAPRLHVRPRILRRLLLSAPIGALLVALAPEADAAELRAPLFLTRTRVVFDSPVAPPLTLVGRPATANRGFSYASFAVELLAYLAKEVLPDSRDEFHGNSNLPSTWSDSMPETSHDFAGHCLEVVQDIGEALTANAPAEMPAVGDTRPSVASAFAQGLGAALAVHDAYKAFENDIEHERRSDVLSIDPKVGSNRIAVAFTLRW